MARTAPTMVDRLTERQVAESGHEVAHQPATQELALVVRVED
jgi:hypothetical protein